VDPDPESGSAIRKNAGSGSVLNICDPKPCLPASARRQQLFYDEDSVHQVGPRVGDGGASPTGGHHGAGQDAAGAEAAALRPGLAIKNPPKKPKKTHLKKPLKMFFFFF
jgi:hypothetical protein